MVKKGAIHNEKLLQWVLFTEVRRMSLWIPDIMFPSKNVEFLCEFLNTADLLHTLISSLKYFKKQVMSAFSYSLKSMTSLWK